jgi:hypothetical protein
MSHWTPRNSKPKLKERSKKKSLMLIKKNKILRILWFNLVKHWNKLILIKHKLWKMNWSRMTINLKMSLIKLKLILFKSLKNSFNSRKLHEMILHQNYLKNLILQRKILSLIKTIKTWLKVSYKQQIAWNKNWKQNMEINGLILLLGMSHLRALELMIEIILFWRLFNYILKSYIIFKLGFIFNLITLEFNLFKNWFSTNSKRLGIIYWFFKYLLCSFIPLLY